MRFMNGVQLAAELRKQQTKAAIVFISVDWEMALRGYEVSAVRYLAKPLEEVKLKVALLDIHMQRRLTGARALH